MARDRTGFTQDQRDALLHRSYGTCEVCNSAPVAHLHHRRPRRMGGARGADDVIVNAVSNGLAVCNVCHDMIESDRAKSRYYGRLVPPSEEPRRTPVYLPRYLGWVLLDDDGNVLWHQNYDAAADAGEALD